MITQHGILMEDPEYRHLYAIEGLVTDAAELVARLMKRQGLSKADLARRLGKSRAWVTQLLSGRANMTIRTYAEVVYALGSEVKLSAVSATVEHDQSVGTHLKAKPSAALCTTGVWQMKPGRQFAFVSHAGRAVTERDASEASEPREYAA